MALKTDDQAALAAIERVRLQVMRITRFELRSGHTMAVALQDVLRAIDSESRLIRAGRHTSGANHSGGVSDTTDMGGPSGGV
jgi:hypothetical protein